MAELLPQDKIFGFPLTYSLENNEQFQQLPPPNRAALLHLAQKFQDHPRSHFLSPEKLSQELGGSEMSWRQFLSMKPVQDFISRRIQEDTKIMARETLRAQYEKATRSGDNQAAKYIKELSQLYEEQSNRTQIILHYIPRPNPQPDNAQPADQQTS